MKKTAAILLVTMILFAISSCKSASSAETSKEAESQTETQTSSSINNVSSNNDVETRFSNTYKLIGFDIAYPEKSDLRTIKAGRTFVYDDYSIIMGAPSAVGDFVGAQNLNDAVDKCQKYVIDIMELLNQDLFSAGATDQEVNETKEISNNDIPMLRVKGQFIDTLNSSKIDYVAYYFLLETDPIYIVGIPLDGNPAGLEEFMDEMAKHISK